MNFCTNCGAGLGLGRFCTNCGTPVARMLPEQPVSDPESGDTVKRQPTGPVTWRTPDLVPPPPPPPPLFAPTPVPPPPPVPGPTQIAPVPTPLTPGEPFIGPRVTDRRHRTQKNSNGLWVALLLLGMVTAAVIGFWLATRESSTGRNPGSVATTPTGPTTDPTTEPPSDEPTDSLDPDDPSDLAPHVRVDGPAPLRPGQDLAGNRVTYPASNMLDDDDETAYRLPGDATGSVITFELPQASTLTAVGLINGYAKTDGSVDWYALNRRILQVEWRFDDGSTVVQDLVSSPMLQTMEIDPVETKTIELRLLEVSPPGRGPRSKNATAISDILLLGE
jgi:hypothetical protein